jgi:hypothetical protein
MWRGEYIVVANRGYTRSTACVHGNCGRTWETSRVTPEVDLESECNRERRETTGGWYIRYLGRGVLCLDDGSELRHLLPLRHITTTVGAIAVLVLMISNAIHVWSAACVCVLSREDRSILFLYIAGEEGGCAPVRLDCEWGAPSRSAIHGGCTVLGANARLRLSLASPSSRVSLRCS